MIEGYGQTEGTGVTCTSQLERVKFGAVGRPLPGCRARIAEDGDVTPTMKVKRKKSVRGNFRSDRGHVLTEETMKHTVNVFCLALAVLTRVSATALPADAAEPEKAPGIILADQAVKTKDLWITSDHSRHAILQKPFNSGPEVTAACLTCHNQAALQFHETIHWTWIDPATADTLRFGKAGMSVNNFCLTILSNEPRCTSCHAGYGWKDKNFDFSSQVNVDCLVCHEQTGTYEKFPAGSGHPAAKETFFAGEGKTFYPPDWNIVAQSVGRPTRENCGVCHFYGGGGDGVKHGDLDSSMTFPNKALDVHMGTDGQKFDCSRCHSTSVHNIAGRVYATPAAKDRKTLIEDDLATKITCESCHSSRPHRAGTKPNDHADKVACQSCHIPTFARVNPTKMWWDWSKAGTKKEGKPYKEVDELGKPSYMTIKGEMRWEKNVKPEYFWYNGSMRYLTLEDTIDPAQPVWITKPAGSPDDPKSRIFPFKIHAGKQPYDKVNKRFVALHLFPRGPEDATAYWKHFDWDKAIAHGMEYAGLPYSGEFDFVETKYLYPITHMVAPKDNVVTCIECHTAQESRMAGLAGFYMPGRDSFRFLDAVGWFAVVASLVGVMLHGLGRIVSQKNRRE